MPWWNESTAKGKQSHCYIVSHQTPAALVGQGSPIAELNWVESVAIALDSKFTLPGTKIRFGLDPVIGLIPLLGNFSTMLISFLLVFVMARYPVSRKVVLLMVLNVLADAIIGSIPILGNIFDFGFKANIRNVSLLKSHYSLGKHKGSGTGILLAIFAALLGLLGLVFFVIYKLTAWFMHLW